MLAKRFFDQRIGFHHVQRFAEAARQRLNVMRLQIFGGKFKHVFFHRFRRHQFIFHAIQPGFQHQRKRQVRVAAWIGAAHFAARRVRFAFGIARNADQGRPVAPRPTQIDRRFIARHQAFVGVDRRRRDRRNRPNMLQDARNVAQGDV